MNKKLFAIVEDLVIGSALALPDNDAFNFLDQTGRKLFWEQGYKGQNVIVAVLDTGVNASHAELAGKVFAGKNFATIMMPDTNTADKHGHGTHVAATIAGQLKCGVAPMAKILPVKVLDDSGMLWDIDWMVQGLNFVYDWKGPNGEKVDIVNMSIGGSGWTAREINLVKTAIQKLNSIGIMVIVSAGNTGKEQIMYPASLDEVISVGAVDINKQIAYFSTKGDFVDLCQIGVDVLSADTKTKDGYVKMSGTSMASPATAGIAALMVCKDKALNSAYNATMSGAALELSYYKQLKNSTIDLGDPGKDKTFGTGFCTLNQRLLKELKFAQGSDKLYVNGVLVQMDAPVTVIKDRTFIPIRYFAENVGGIVTYKSRDDISVLV